MTKLQNIEAQIAKLQKQASELKAKEFDKTLQEILAKMDAYGITLKDLQAAMSKGVAGRGRKAAAPKKKSHLAGAKVGPKYRGPDGQTWTGRGQAPRWLADLVSQGRSREEFLIPPATGEAQGA